MLGSRVASFLKANGWVANLLVIALGAYFVAGAANAVVASSIRKVPSIEDGPEVGRARSAARDNDLARGQFSAIAERNLMGAKRENLNPVADEPHVGEEQGQLVGRDYNETDLKPCTIPAALRATLVAEDAPEWSIAVLYNNSTRDTVVHTINEGGNQIASDAVLVDIRPRQIVVRRRDHFELCSADGDAKTGMTTANVAPRAAEAPPPSEGEGVTKMSEDQYVIARTEVDGALSNLNEVATQARIVPSFKNGKPNGFKLFSIKPGSIYSKVGLQNGDVIQKINGYEMNSPDKALEIYQKLKDAQSINIEMLRRGQTKSMSYEIR